MIVFWSQYPGSFRFAAMADESLVVNLMQLSAPKVAILAKLIDYIVMFPAQSIGKLVCS